ncbi:PDZK1-interacting protein 1 [Odontesthes bonariensis]
MGKVSVLTSCLLLAAGDAVAQTARPNTSERLLPQWLTGIIAVSGFLLLTFVAFLVKKVWCEEPDRRRSSVESVRENEYVDRNPYDTRLDVMRKRESEESDKEKADGDTYETSLEALRSKDNRNAYTNLVIDSSDDKVTSM